MTIKMITVDVVFSHLFVCHCVVLPIRSVLCTTYISLLVCLFNDTLGNRVIMKIASSYIIF